MGKAKIVSHIADSEYSVIYYNDMTIIDNKILKLSDDILFYIGEIGDYESLIIGKNDEVNAQRAFVDSLINQYEICIRTNDIKEKCDLLRDAVNKENIELLKKGTELRDLNELQEDKEILLEKAKREKARIETVTGEQPMNIFCVDVCDRDPAEPDAGIWENHGEIIPVDTIVGTIDVFNFATKEYDIFIQAASYSRDPAYIDAFHGISSSVLSSDGNGFVYNYNMRGPQASWGPLYRLASIASIDNGIASVTYNENKDQDGVIFNAIDLDANSNIPSDYMLCNTSPPFVAGDNVIVTFSGVKMASPKIIGYQSYPQPCVPIEPSILACHLSSGSLVFEYNQPGDATVFLTENNVTANRLSDGNRHVTGSTTWFTPDGSKSVTSVFPDVPYDGKTSLIDPGSGPDIPPLGTHIIDREYVTYFVGKKAVARLPFGHPTFPDSTYATSHAHIETVLGVDYIVAYRLWGAFDLVIDKYRIPYNTAINSPTVLDLVFDKSSTTSGTPFLSTRFPETIDVKQYQFGTDIPEFIDNNYTWTINTSKENRILTCNQDGTKTVIYGTTDDGTGLYKDYRIIELTDIDTGVSGTSTYELSLHSTWVKEYYVAGVGSQTVSGGRTNHSAASATCDPNTDVMTNSTGTSSWSRSGTENFSGEPFPPSSKETIFMGASYDKYTDELIVLSRQLPQWPGGGDTGSQFVFGGSGSGTINFTSNSDGSQTVTDTSQTDIVTTTMNKWDTSPWDIFINGVTFRTINYIEETQVGDDYFNETRTLHKVTSGNDVLVDDETVSGTYTATFNYSYKKRYLRYFNVIDLSARLFLLDFWETHAVLNTSDSTDRGTTVFYSPFLPSGDLTWDIQTEQNNTYILNYNTPELLINSINLPYIGAGVNPTTEALEPDADSVSFGDCTSLICGDNPHTSNNCTTTLTYKII